MTSKRYSDKQFQSLQKESRKLYQDVEALEDALTLHKRFKEETDNSIRGMIRKELGGAIWQHGGSGKLRTYRSARDLIDKTENVDEKQKRLKSKSAVSKQVRPRTSSPVKDFDIKDTVLGNNEGKALQNDVNIEKKRNFGNDKSKNETNVAENTTLAGGGICDLDNVAEMKSKVLEKASANVIKRKKVVAKDQEILSRNKDDKSVPVGKGKSSLTEKVVKKLKSSTDYKEINVTPVSNSNLVKTTNTIRALERQTSLLSDSNNRKQVRQTNRIPTETDGHIQSEEYKLSDVVSMPSKSNNSGESPTRQSESSSSVGRGHARLLSKSSNCDPDVHLWLRQLCLLEEEKYVQMFAVNEIDMGILVGLNEKQLEKMGVVALGAMKKLIAGIDELKNGVPKLRKSSSLDKNSGLKICSEKGNSLALDTKISVKNKKQSSIEVKSQTGNLDPSLCSLSGRKQDVNHSHDLQNKKSLNNLTDERLPHNEKKNRKTSEVNIKPEKSVQNEKTSKSEINNVKSDLKISVKEDQYDKFVRSTSVTVKSESVVRKSKCANAKTEGETKQDGNQQRKSVCNKAGKGRDGSCTNKMRTRSRPSSASSATAKSLMQPKSSPSLTKGKVAETVQRKATEGLTLAARRFEEKSKIEIKNTKKRQREQEKQKVFRDEMAAKHLQRKKREREKSEERRIEMIASDEDLTSSEEEDCEQLMGIKVMSSEKKDMKPPLPNQEKGKEGKQFSRTVPPKVPARQSLAIPANSMQLNPDFIGLGTPQRSARSQQSSRHLTRYSFSAKKNTVKDIESQIESLQRKAVAGEMVTMDLVKDLQKRLEEVELQIKQSDGMKDKGYNSQTVSQKNPRLTEENDENEDVLHPMDDFDFNKLTSGKVKTKGISMSMSKKDLLKEIHKEKVVHRKQIRQLHSELNRIRHADPNKTVEVSTADIEFQESGLIGEGAFSRVYHGLYQGTEVAIKQLKVPLSSHDRNYFAAEVSLLRDLRHPRVVLLMGVVTSERLPLMILEYMARGSLYHLLHDPSRDALDHAEFYRYAHDIALGMNYLHQHKPTVLHLDLKSMNVLICSNDRAKIADFGFSKFRHDADLRATQSSKVKPVRGSPVWMAPELLETGDITPKADVYSFAIILWEMLTRKQPYEGCSVFQVLERTRLNKRPEIPGTCPKQLSDFICQCWDPLPSRRPSFKDVLQRLENMAFPPDWQALLKEAGVPPVALEDVQSTRTIISLVNTSLNIENVKTMVEDIKQSCDSMDITIHKHDSVEMYDSSSSDDSSSPRSHDSHVVKDTSDDILAVENEETFAGDDDLYLQLTDLRSSTANSVQDNSRHTILKPVQEHSASKATQDCDSLQGTLMDNENLLAVTPSVVSDSVSHKEKQTNIFRTDLHDNKMKINLKQSAHSFVSNQPLNQPARPDPVLTEDMIKSMVRDKRVAVVSKSIDMKSLKESIHSQLKQSPKILRSSLDVSKQRMVELDRDSNANRYREKSIKPNTSVGKSPVPRPEPNSVRNNRNDISQETDIYKETNSKASGGKNPVAKEELCSVLDQQNEKSKITKTLIEKESQKPQKSFKQDQNREETKERPVPTPRNITSNTNSPLIASSEVDDLNAQLQRKIAERNRTKKDNEALEHSTDISHGGEGGLSAKVLQSGAKSVLQDSLDCAKESTKLSVRKSKDVNVEDDVSVIDSLEVVSPRDSLEEKDTNSAAGHVKDESAKGSVQDRANKSQVSDLSHSFTVVTNSAPKFKNSTLNTSNKLNDSLNSSLKSNRQSIEAWVEVKLNAEQNYTPQQKSRKITPPSPVNCAPPPILIPSNPPPPPPAPPIPVQDGAFLVVKSNVEPKKEAAKSETTTKMLRGKENSSPGFMVQSVELREKKELLQSTSKPHPNQLQDLSVVSRGTMSSIAEILKRAVFDRRVAMGEDNGSPPPSVRSSWSFMDD